MLKFKFSIIPFIIWIAVIPAYNYKNQSSTQQSTSTSIYTVEKWAIKNSIEVVWDAQLVDEQSLSFNKEWTITKVNFKEWETIKKWDIIAELDSSDVYDSIEEAKINLENANINLEQLYEWPDESQILQAKNSITNAENSLTIAKKELETTKKEQDNSIYELEKNIENSKKELESSKKSLELAKKELETTKKEQDNSLNNTVSSKSTTVQNIEDSFKSNLVDIEKIIEQSDYIMWVSDENEEKNDSFEDFLWAEDKVVKNQTENSLLESISLYNNLKSSLDLYKYNWNLDEMKSLLQKFLNLYQKLANTTDLIYKTVDNSLVSEWTLSNSDIESKKNTMSSYRSSSLSKVSSINSSINTLNTLSNTDLISESNSNSISQKEENIKTSELSITKKELEIENSEKDLEITLEKNKTTLEAKENDVKSKETSLEIAKLNLEELLEWPTSENIAKANNSIKQAKLKLESAYKSLDDYRLEAPFNWVVRKIDYMVWDNITNDTDKYVYIENPDLLEITVKLDQIDITKVKLNWQANIVFDAYSSITVNAIISSIDTQPIETSWVVSYEVKLVLDDSNFDKKVLSWMSANVEIIVESKENIPLVKTSAISE